MEEKYTHLNKLAEEEKNLHIKLNEAEKMKILKQDRKFKNITNISRIKTYIILNN